MSRCKNCGAPLPAAHPRPYCSYRCYAEMNRDWEFEPEFDVDWNDDSH